MAEFWIISAPGEKTPQNTFERLDSATNSGSDRLSDNHRFNIPELKVCSISSVLDWMKVEFSLFNFRGKKDENNKNQYIYYVYILYLHQL